MGALDGIRVLDLGLLVQGPQAAAMLSDMGADVIKVELPGMGDQARWIPISMQDLRAPYFVGCNRGKRSVTIDLRTPDGADIFMKLAETSDVMISNFKAGTLDDWGLSYEAVSARNPGIVYATGSLLGPTGPDARREGADIIGQAAGGLISTTGRDGGEPTPVGVTIADHIASQNMTSGILAALFARERTGRGQRVDVSLLGGQIWAQASEYSYYFLTGDNPGRSNLGHPLLHAVYGIFPTADGHVAMAGVPPQLRSQFYAALGREDLLDVERFAALLMEPHDKFDLFEELSETFKTKTTDEWCAILTEAGQRVAPVRAYDAVVDDPQAWVNSYFVETTDANGAPTRVVGAPIRMSETPLSPSGVLPELGQNTEEVLLELGYDWDEISRLRDAGAI